jgi:hypothetical protein
MAYTINLTDGSIFATVADGTINTSSSMILVGKNYAGYGEFLDENFIHLLENGANSVPPGAPLTGQLWWDKATSTMKVYTGVTFKTISAATSSPTTPTNNVTGDLWWDTVNQQLKVWNGASFVLIGPAFTPGTGQSGAIVSTITDNVAVDHIVIQLFVQNVLVGIISKDATFTPSPSIPGFTTISPGISLSTAVGSNLFRGIATNAQLLDGLDSTQFLRSDSNDTTSGTLGILNDTGLSFGVDQDGRLAVVTATSEVIFRNQTQDANLTIRVNDGGVDTTVMSVNGATSVVTFPTAVTFTSTISTTGNVTVGNLATSIASVSDIVKTGSNAVGNIGQSTNLFNTIFANVASVGSIAKSGANGVGNIGSSTNSFNIVFAQSTSAQYADVAERFAADAFMEPGTVVELGGSAEITVSENELSESVFGVISTRAAYLMNSGAGSDDTHPAVAMTGRVPVKCRGVIHKGDRLVSAGQGLARAANVNEISPFNVIGRALQDKLTQDIGIVEAIVTIK